MHSNLIATLLRFAAHPAPREEDPITEILAWILDRERALLGDLVALAATRCPALAPLTANVAAIAVDTQVVVPRVHSGTSRYDLVLDLGAPRVRLVLEVKVRAELTASRVGDGTVARTQIDDYLAIAERWDGTSIVMTLGPEQLVVGETREHRSFGGHVYWQEIHDIVVRQLRRHRETQSLDATVMSIAEQFVGALEEREMTTPRLTFDGILSVRKYMQFRAAYEDIITSAWLALHEDHTLDGFVKIDRRAWQDGHQRLGYRLWTSRNETAHLGFMGIRYGEDTILDDVPDLLFFVEVAPRTPAADALAANASVITAAVERLAARDARVRWQYVPSGWSKILVARSLADVVAEPDPRTAVSAFFRDVVRAARSEGLLDVYFRALSPPV